MCELLFYKYIIIKYFILLNVIKHFQQNYLNQVEVPWKYYKLNLKKNWLKQIMNFLHFVHAFKLSSFEVVHSKVWFLIVLRYTIL